MIAQEFKTQNGNAFDLLKEVPDNSIDLILTDPPYNISKYSTGNISLSYRENINNDLAEWDKIEFKPEKLVDDFMRILKPSGNLFAFTSYNMIGEWHRCFDPLFRTFQFMIWHKTNPAPKIFKAGFLNSCEMIICCWDKGHTWNFLSQDKMHNFIETPICMGPERLKSPKHAAQKPVQVLKHIIERASNEGDVVLDPFMGVGSTGVAALQMDRKFIGYELDKVYFDAAEKRLSTYSKKKEAYADQR